MTGIAEMTCITGMTVVFTCNIVISLVRETTSSHQTSMTGMA